MVTLSIKQRGKSFPDIIKEIENIWFEVQEAVPQLGRETLQNCKDNLSEKKRTGSENNLASNLDYDEITGMGIVGFSIGDVSKLDKSAPYWRFLNDGAIVDSDKMMPPGHFAPGSPYPEDGATSDSRWHKGPGANGRTYSFPVKYVVTGNHWLDKAIYRMRIRLAYLLKMGKLK